MTMSRSAGGAGKQRPIGRLGAASRLSGSWQLPESHLLPDAVVAFVDGELSLGAHERAAMHLMRCAGCAAEVDAQRKVRAAMHDSHVPSMPAGLLASLNSIPDRTELPAAPDNLAVTADGQLVAIQRPSALGSTAPLGSTTPLGAVGMGAARKGARRTAQGAGVVVSGLVLSALALAVTVEEGRELPSQPGGKAPVANSGVAPAKFTGVGLPTTSQSAAPTSLPDVGNLVVGQR